MTNLPQVFVFKYKIGDKFKTFNGDIVEITGYNHLWNTYKGITMFERGNSTARVESSMLYETYLDGMTRYNPMQELAKKDTPIRYKIYYFDQEPNGKVAGQKAQDITIELTNLRALARMLNSMRKRNPNRRITLVCVVDEDGRYLTHVKFLPQEIKTQTFLTGMKERLLAHAKYERGYEVAIGF